MWRLLLLAILLGVPTSPSFAGPGQDALTVTADLGASCVLVRDDKIIAQTRINTPIEPQGLLGQSEPLFVDTQTSHAPIVVTCFAAGFHSSSITVRYARHEALVDFICVVRRDASEEEQKAAKACSRRVAQSNNLRFWMGYPEFVKLRLVRAP